MWRWIWTVWRAQGSMENREDAQKVGRQEEFKPALMLKAAYRIIKLLLSVP